MKRFAYICADSGIPIPGHKGSSNHVRNVCRALRARGLGGTIFARRAEDNELEGYPVVKLVRGRLRDARYDFVYERYSLWHIQGLDWARRMGVPFVLEVNSPLPDEARKYRTLDNPQLAEEVAERLLREADGVVCVSDEVADWVANYRPDRSTTWTVPNGVDADEFSPQRTALRAPFECPSGPTLGFAGSFRPWHGVEALLDILVGTDQRAGLDARVLCIGDGPGRAQFDARAQQLGLASRVHTTGFVPQPEVAAWLNGCDVAVAPYEPHADFYFSPLKVFEFMALGLPVVAADIGQLAEILGDDRGWLYPPGDADGLAAAIVDVLADVRAARERADRARRWVLETATWKHRVGAILDRVNKLRASYA